jgi:hypothetical protein
MKGYELRRQIRWARCWQRLPAETRRVVLAALAGGLLAAIGWRLAGW